ncbi:MAG: 3-ketoacyl-CoA thiolase with broad chain length specificity [Chaenotheca gracillima]|nr:MAG: 3-ketoacyl-CoA thiolase with broad chain length specificity [Chaenotheca gracillima]
MSGAGAANQPPGSASLESLFASLRTQASNGNPKKKDINNFDIDPARSQSNQGSMPPFAMFGSNPPSRQGSYQPTVSSPIPDVDPRGPQPHHRSAAISPNVLTPGTNSPAPNAGQASADRSANLLNLLKFNQSGSNGSPAPRQSQDSTGQQQAAAAQGNQNAGISASDLVASFMGKQPPQPTTSRTPSFQSVGASKPEVSRDFAESSPQPSAHTQDYLMKLLNRRKASPTDTPSFQADKLLTPDGIAPEPSPARGSQDGPVHVSRTEKTATENEGSRPFSPGERTSSKPSQSLFTYVNPFEQLAASSPRHRTPKVGTPGSGHATPDVDTLRSEATRRSNHGSPAPRRASPRTENEAINEAISHMSSPPPAALPDGRSQVEALLGIGAENNDPETVAEALTEVGESVSQEVDDALAAAENRQGGRGSQEVFEDLNEDVKDFAADVKHELDRSENEGVLEETLPAPVADAVKDLIDGAAEANENDNWESADDPTLDNTTSTDRVVRVYNFPMRPFSTLSVQSIKWPNPLFRPDAVMDIARLKKEFDQIDRTLATATKDFIVYAMSKNGGFRIIRQDDGRDKQVFGSTKDRVFTIAAGSTPTTSPTTGMQAVLATGISGTVYWMPISKDGRDVFDDEEMERHRIVLPPTHSAEESTSGGQLKTRARQSSRHPEFFAVGRGKSIHIVWPFIAGSAGFLANRKDRIVDTQKYLQERCLKIATGKAGKDFTFSEDDSVIASLDKLGRLRFWDIRDLTDEAFALESGNVPPQEIKTPISTFLTIAPAEKAWPSSVMFVDKSRPYTRGTALRYMILGMKQNHTLQLWDLALGRAIQELNLPHSNESDAICSVAYHHPSNVLVVGHPTRNSIYFIHISAPRYNLSPMAQARYIERLERKDPTLPKPEVTAIMSGFREYSLDSKGQLRSVDILSQPSATSDDPENPLLFELYVMHSKGVSCLSINREDLGWSKDNKVLHPVDAEERSVISVRELLEISAASTPAQDSASTVNGDQPSTASASATSLIPPPAKASRQAGPGTDDEKVKRKEKPVPSSAPGLNNHKEVSGNISDKQEKKTKKRTGGETPLRAREESAAPPSSASQLLSADSKPSPAPATSTKASKPQKSNATQNGETVEQATRQEPQQQSTGPPSTNVGISNEAMDQEMKRIEKSISLEFTKVISHELENVYRRFDEDKRIQQASADAKQDAVLRLVSSTLSENVEKSLARIVGQNIQQSVVPSIVDVTASTLNRHVSEAVRNHFQMSLGRELRNALPETIGRAFQSPDVLRTVSDLVADKVAVHVESEFSSVLHGTISPAFKQLALDSAQKIAGEVQRRTAEQIEISDIQRQNDSQKIEELHGLVRSLTITVSKMAEAQTEFQNEILKLQRQVHQVDTRQSHASSSPGQDAAGPSRQLRRETPRKDPRQEEHDRIVGLMREDRFEEATLQWLQSSQQEELFDNVFVHCDPSFLQSLYPLVILSVAASITSNLESNVRERLDWLTSCFACVSPNDPELQEVLPKIMDVLVQRLEALYMRIAETNHQDPLLRKIPSLTRAAKQLKLAGASPGGRHSVHGSDDSRRFGM